MIVSSCHTKVFDFRLDDNGNGLWLHVQHAFITDTGTVHVYRRIRPGRELTEEEARLLSEFFSEVADQLKEES